MISSHSDFIRVRGLRYHVRRWGDPAAPKVFLLHGWLDTSATWHPVAVGLLPDFQVLCPDWRGFGHSEWPQDGYWFQDYVADLEAVLDHYVTPSASAGDNKSFSMTPASASVPVVLIGHSMGGQVASLYAGLRPERVKTLACLDSLFLPDMEMSLAPKRFRAWLDELKDLPEQKTYSSFEELAARVRKQHPQLSPERALFVARGWGREDANGRITLCADPKHRLRGPGLYHAEESVAIWHNVSARTLFLDGGKSLFAQAIPQAEVQRRRSLFRDRREEIIENAGHMLHFDAPEETARRIAEFLQT